MAPFKKVIVNKGGKQPYSIIEKVLASNELGYDVNSE